MIVLPLLRLMFLQYTVDVFFFDNKEISMKDVHDMEGIYNNITTEPTTLIIE